jgi:hypothetical protein
MYMTRYALKKFKYRRCLQKLGPRIRCLAEKCNGRKPETPTYGSCSTLIGKPINILIARIWEKRKFLLPVVGYCE